MVDGHSNELVLLIFGCALIATLFGYLHARRHWEGLPPMLDGLYTGASFLALVGAFVAGGRIGLMLSNHPHAGRVIALLMTFLLLRAVRTWLGKEQERYRKLGAKAKAEDA